MASEMTKRILTIITTFFSHLILQPFSALSFHLRELLMHFCLQITNTDAHTNKHKYKHRKSYYTDPTSECMLWVCWFYTFFCLLQYIYIHTCIYIIYPYDVCMLLPTNKNHVSFILFIYLFIRIYLFNGPIKTLFRFQTHTHSLSTWIYKKHAKLIFSCICCCYYFNGKLK